MDMIRIEPNETRICSKCSFNTCMLNKTKGFKKQFCVCVFLNSLYRLRGIKSLCENVVWHQNLQQRVLLVRVFITFSTFSFVFQNRSGISSSKKLSMRSLTDDINFAREWSFKNLLIRRIRG